MPETNSCKIVLAKILFAMLVFCVISDSLYARKESIYFGAISSESGLSEMSVSSIFQDNKGFLWFGTRDGLNRFDGYNFEVFRTDDADSTTISNNNISSIIEDKNGDLWIATENGLNCYHYSSNKFSRFYKSNFKEGISHNKVGSLHYDKKGRLWVGTEQGLDLFDFSTRTFIKTTLDGLLFNNRILSLLCDSYGSIWIGTLNTGLIRYNPETGAYKVYAGGGTGTDKFRINTVRTIFEDSRRNLWIGTKTGLWLYNPQKNSFQLFGKDIYKGEKLSNEGIRCIAQDRENNLLIGTNEGFNILNTENGNLSIYNPLKNGKGNLNHFYIYSIFVDDAGTVWLGNYMGGINYYNNFNQQFLFSNPGNQGQLIYGGVGPMAENGDKLWIGTSGGGIFCLDKLQNTYSQFQFEDSSYVSNVIKSICNKGDTIFLGTEESAFLIFDTRRKKMLKSIRVAKNPIVNIYPDKGKKLFLCVRDSIGLRTFDSGTGLLTPYTYVNSVNGRKMLFPYASCMEKENDSIYWIGTRYTGIYRYNQVTNSAVRYTNRPYDPGSICSNHITDIYSDSRNNIWIGTGGNGLCVFSKESGQFKTYTEKDGLVNRIVLGILPDKAGFLWISTISGISRFDPVNKSFKNYTYGNGFPLQEPAENSFIKLSDGKLCFGGNNGLVTFSPEKIISNSFIPPVIITDFRLLRSDQEDGDLILAKKFPADSTFIRLNHNQSSFIIQFTALNYIFPEKNQYAYKLEGFDYEWNNVGQQRIAIYTNLHSGNYCFKIKASNNDGVWNEKYITLNIKVLPPPWLSWYAYIIYFVIFAGLYYSLFRYIKLENKVKIKQIEQENMEKVHQMRIRMFTNFSHELRTPLTLIIGPLEDLMSRVDIGPSILQPLSMIQSNAHRLLLIVNQLMDFRKQESGKMQLKAVEANVATYMKEIFLVFSELARKQKINYTFNSGLDEITLWFDRLLLEKVLFNLLSNAFKNTPEGGTISLDVNIKSLGELIKSGDLEPLTTVGIISEYVEIIVSDNGKGISAENIDKIFDPFYQVLNSPQVASAGTGIGLSLSKGIVELHSGIIRAESRLGSGSVFKVLLPRGKKHLNDNEIINDYKDGEDHVHYLLPKEIEIDDNVVLTDPDKELYTVLVVEDNFEVRNYIKAYLKDSFNILEAENGEEGFSIAVSKMPDLIISDVMMPGMDGLELCSKLKSDVNTSHIPVILLSALATDIQIKQGFEVGSDDCISKPFNPLLLKMKVSSLIGNRERLRKVFGKRFPFELASAESSNCDEKFLDKIYAILDKQLSNSEFDIDTFSDEIGMSRANLYRKIKVLTNLAPNELIKNYRLRAAVKLLTENKYSVSEISYMVGFGTPAYFSNCFKKTYQLSPSAYLEHNSSK